METHRKSFVVMMVALVGLVGRASAQDRLMHEARDPITGSVAQVYQTSHGPRIDLLADSLQVRKEVVDGRVKTTITGGGASLVIEAGPKFLSVVSGGRKVVATAAKPAPLETAKRLVAESPLAARAAALIGKLGFGDRSPLQPLLLTTRAFLLAAKDDATGSRELGEWMSRTRNAAHVIPASLGQKTPGDCWKGYGDELVDAFTEYVQCVQSLRWYDVFGERGCAVIYEVRIIGAFTWWASCVSLRDPVD